jgi:hypothetical protein
MKTLKVLFFCSAFSLLTLLRASADDDISLLLNQYAGSLGPPADMEAVSVTATYNPGTFNLTAAPDEQIGYTDAGGNGFWINNGIFTVSANIDSSGYLSSGSLTVKGFVNALNATVTSPANVYIPDVLLGTLKAGMPGDPPGTALVGSAYDYATTVGAFDDGGDFSLIDFTFTVTGGALADDFGGVGSQAVISFSSWQESGPIGDWTTSWNNSGAGMCDVFPVPEPTTAGCFLLGLGVLACFRRFTQNRRS